MRKFDDQIRPSILVLREAAGEKVRRWRERVGEKKNIFIVEQRMVL